MLIDDLLTRRIPASFCSGCPRVNDGAWPTSLDVDDRYPDPWAVEQIGLVSFARAREWLLTVLPGVWAELAPFGKASVTEVDGGHGPEVRIDLATGGWSGCEEVIGAILSHPMMAAYLEARHSGGRYVFVVPKEET